MAGVVCLCSAHRTDPDPRYRCRWWCTAKERGRRRLRAAAAQGGAETDFEVEHPTYDTLKPAEDPLGQSGSECQYGDVGVQLDPFTPERLEQLAKQQGAKWTSISGVGDRAYLYDDKLRSTRTVNLFIVSGAHVVTIQFGSDDLKEPIDSIKPRLTELATAMLARLQ
jgi:hypothetical protein